MRGLEALEPDNLYAGLPPIFYSRHRPEPLANQFLVHFNRQVAEQLGIDPDEAACPDLAARLTAQFPDHGMDTLALCYAGHQFGHYVPRLGDGRALLLGQVVDPSGRRWDLQIKGSGRTLYSRQGDGKAVLRSTIREHLASAAMQGLGIPTTLSLAMFGSEEPVYRERVETGAMLVRVAPSHIRFGSFEYFFYNGRYDDLSTLVNFTLDHYFPDLRQTENPVLALLRETVMSTARLMARWQGVGFCHGVMNTDNMSVHGITIDYGPYGFLDAYDPRHVCNHSDHHGRYAYDQQPRIALFNLSCLAQALLPLVHEDPETAAQLATEVLRTYEAEYDRAWLQERCRKLGLTAQHPGDGALFDALLDLMQAAGADFSGTFRALSEGPAEDVVSLLGESDALDAWLSDYRARLDLEHATEGARRERACRANPKYVLRNYLAEKAIRLAEDERDFSEIERLVRLLESPYEYQAGMDRYADTPPAWARSIEVSCSS